MIYTGGLYQHDEHTVIDIIFLLFPLDKGHVPENLWQVSLLFCKIIPP